MNDGIPAGYSEVRYAISIDSPAPTETIDELIELVQRHSPYLDVFGRAMPLRGSIHLNGRGA